jgi:hypothetical protein
MSRGKQQVLFNYLPGKTFDFERVATIALVVSIRGVPRTDLNTAVLLRKVQEEAQAWGEGFRPLLRNDVLRQANHFILLPDFDTSRYIFPDERRSSLLNCKALRHGRLDTQPQFIDTWIMEIDLTKPISFAYHCIHVSA